MALVLPNNYIELEQEEMMYIDGTGIPRWTVSVGVDGLLLLTPIGIATAPLKYLGKQAAKTLVTKYAPNIAGITAWALRTVVGASINISTSTLINLIVANAASFTSIGGIVVFLGDYADGNLNGWIG